MPKVYFLGVRLGQAVNTKFTLSHFRMVWYLCIFTYSIFNHFLWIPIDLISA